MDVKTRTDFSLKIDSGNMEDAELRFIDKMVAAGSLRGAELRITQVLGPPMLKWLEIECNRPGQLPMKELLGAVTGFALSLLTTVCAITGKSEEPDDEEYTRNLKYGTFLLLKALKAHIETGKHPAHEDDWED